MAEYEWMTDVRAMVGREYGRTYAWDRVNEAMIRQWCEVMGVVNPLYTDADVARQSEFGAIVAPPAMLQAWCLAGLNDEYPPGSTEESPYEVLKQIEAQGYPSVVAVNSELTFDRYITVGERLYYTTRLESISEEKTTGLGTGFFVTLIMTYFSEQPSAAEPDPGKFGSEQPSIEDEKVGELLFRVFKFRAAQRDESQANANKAKAADHENSAEKPAIKRPQPGVSDDTRFFWEGAREGKLLIQHCTACDRLQHPPGPVCMHCHAFELDSVEVSGGGELYSFVIMHYPEVPPFEHPNPIGLIELDEGVRLIAGLVDVDQDALEIGQRLQVEFRTFDDDLTLPLFRPASA
ncbi:OB-fold domain-containing protein [Halomonas sp. PR-M31]|uniref:OB-fold domain-containing protein n=1 Tax=Halomonas sp. PR-M31 TaxID=1471202 RepID=UPI00069F83DB|nr:OB-fold domain-containing protein [Halomonas sp. PR-M31]